MAVAADRAFQYMWQESFERGLREPGYCKIVILGVGGCGNNTISRLTESGIVGAECIAINTDLQHLQATHALNKVLIGENVTKGLGAGGDPEVGRRAIEESRKKIEDLLVDVDIAFVTAGMGGGTGTGAAPVVAQIAREKGAIVVGVVTMPFNMERGRMRYAIQGLREMRKACDTVAVIDNNKLLKLASHLPLTEAFLMADQTLSNMVKGIVETISAPSLVNLDFADFKTIIKRGGVAIVGIGESDSENRAEEAVKKALNCPLLDVDYSGAKGALIHVAGDKDMTIEEANLVGEMVTKAMDEEALVIWGARIDPNLNGKIRITLLMTGVRSPYLLSGYSNETPRLYNLDDEEEFRGKLNLNLHLDQIEV